MKVLFDTNVVLDVLLNREPFATDGAKVMNLVDRGELAGYLGATTLTTIHYLASRTLGNEVARRKIRKLLTLFQVAPVNRRVLDRALDLPLRDYEDAVLHEAALAVSVDAIVTRDESGFTGAEIPALSPAGLLAAVAELEARS